MGPSSPRELSNRLATGGVPAGVVLPIARDLFKSLRTGVNPRAFRIVLALSVTGDSRLGVLCNTFADLASSFCVIEAPFGDRVSLLVDDLTAADFCPVAS